MDARLEPRQEILTQGRTTKLTTISRITSHMGSFAFLFLARSAGWEILRYEVIIVGPRGGGSREGPSMRKMAGGASMLGPARSMKQKAAPRMVLVQKEAKALSVNK
jgi:hypothetical protein